MINSEEFIRFLGVTKEYTSLSGRLKTKALNNVSFVINTGEIFSILGPNGAGKTTIIKILCGLLLPTEGQITIKELSPKKYQRRYQNAMGVVLDGHRGLYDKLTIVQNLDYFGTMWGFNNRSKLYNRIDYLLETFGFEDDRDKKISDFSRGMYQKASLAMALLLDPVLLLLDEPLLGVDVESSAEIKKIISRLSHQEGKTILLTSHQLNVVEELSDRVAILKKGKLIALDTVSMITKGNAERTYEFSIRGELSDILKGESGSIGTLKNYEFNKKTNVSVCQIVLAPGKSYYHLLDILRNQKLELIQVREMTPNLEDVFLELIHEDN